MSTAVQSRARSRPTHLVKCMLLAGAAGLAPGCASVHAQETERLSYSFRLGELRDQEARAKGHCKQQNLGVALVGIEYSNSPEGFYYSAKFECGSPPAFGFPASYKQGDRGRLEEDISGYCNDHGKQMARQASEPAPRADTFKAT